MKPLRGAARPQAPYPAARPQGRRPRSAFAGLIATLLIWLIAIAVIWTSLHVIAGGLRPIH